MKQGILGNWTARIWSRFRARPTEPGKLLNWTADNKLEIDGVSFRCTLEPAEYHTFQSTENDFLLIKSREMIETDLKVFLEGRRARNVIDIGIWQGGSVVLLDLLLNPRKLLGIEYNPTPVPALAAYIAERKRRNVSIQYGVDQGATQDMIRILNDTFGDEPIDLVIDDASHQYAETKRSFEAIFPRMAPGAHFIIEDWQWSIVDGMWQLDYFKDKPGLVNLVVEIAAVLASRRDLVSEVVLLPFCAIVTRGTAPYSKVPLALDDIASSRGAAIDPVL